ncbi:sprT domain-containing protein [Arsenicibacter rosenii]|uniref:SprT domain-containing protein n=1 Tax=Arsenicibacter rosenii TaxID=1750698 RepID=A0A1S2VNX6_9BACT|nr:sprT domain-containing protein [Arsenicibacter rosenii]OIN60469.1 sprT domain-containing protein [Arsenicibacter rosenii]
MDVLAKYLPAASVSYCLNLWQHYAFQLKIARTRKTKLGDFRAPGRGQLQISVNADLNPFAFLITYIHEVAHADVYVSHTPRQLRTMKPHGPAWQQAFQRLMQPVLTEEVFPDAILEPLRVYMQAPAATSQASPALVHALRQADPVRHNELKPNDRLLALRDLAEGELFQFREKTYQRGTLRRTRVVCKEISSSKSYAILAHALVEKCE